MKYDRHLRHEHPSLPTGVDYSHPGIYFVTLCTLNGQEIFGAIESGEMHCSPLGRIARFEWFRTGERHNEIQLFKSEFVVMPNHIHGIVWVTGKSPLDADVTRPGPVQPENALPDWVRSNKVLANDALLNRTRVRRMVRPQHKGASEILASFLTGYKAAVVERCGRDLDPARIWQTDHSKQLIRNEEKLNDLRVYINTNPLHWAEDLLNTKDSKEHKEESKDP